MIYLVKKAHDYTVRGFLDSRRSDGLECSIDLVYYEDLTELQGRPESTIIFSDHERLSPAQTELVTDIWKQLEAKGRVRLVNDPRKVLRRRELLQKLHRLGRNNFNVFRPDQAREQIRFPVFLREEREHTGSLTGLLSNHHELSDALERIANSRTLGARDLLIVEFYDTSVDGVHSKFSAFRVLDRIIPRYLQFSEDWEVKNDNSMVSEEMAQRELDYLQKDPHRDWIMETFELANIEYGRMDYGMLGDQPQVWEINTNPMMAGLPNDLRVRSKTREERRKTVEEGRKLSHTRFRKGLLELEAATSGSGVVQLDLSPAKLRKLRSETSRMQLRRFYSGGKRMLRKLFKVQ